MKYIVVKRYISIIPLLVEADTPEQALSNALPISDLGGLLTASLTTVYEPLRVMTKCTSLEVWSVDDSGNAVGDGPVLERSPN